MRNGDAKIVSVKIVATRLVAVWLIFLLVASTLAVAQEPPPQQPPDNVAGNWTIYSKGPNGTTSTKYIELKQEGGVITGHFKGPYQSGGLEGTVDIHHIVFRTKTREPLTFRGRVDGNKITGTFHDRQGTGEWQAVRDN